MRLKKQLTLISNIPAAINSNNWHSLFYTPESGRQYTHSSNDRKYAPALRRVRRAHMTRLKMQTVFKPTIRRYSQLAIFCIRLPIDVGEKNREHFSILVDRHVRRVDAVETFEHRNRILATLIQTKRVVVAGGNAKLLTKEKCMIEAHLQHTNSREFGNRLRFSLTCVICAFCSSVSICSTSDRLSASLSIGKNAEIFLKQ